MLGCFVACLWHYDAITDMMSTGACQCSLWLQPAGVSSADTGTYSLPLHLYCEGSADLVDVLRLHILFKYEFSQLGTGRALQQPAGLTVLRHPPLLPDVSNRGSA